MSGVHSAIGFGGSACTVRIRIRRLTKNLAGLPVKKLYVPDRNMKDVMMLFGKTGQITAWTSFCAILLREARAERGLHQAQVADALGQTASAWTKVEAGKSPLQFETLFRVCSYLGTQPSTVMGVAERYGMIFQQNGWAVLFNQSNSLEQDHLFTLAQAYWASPGGKMSAPSVFNFTSILSGPTYNSNGTVNIAPVFQYALDRNFREWQDKYEPLALNIGGNVNLTDRRD